ncbi:MAG TPA: ATP-binding cassette domain-containing protein [Ktedonobacteraceae bacterium]|nr:ATP-binding cassette domain-containing protein [Ktedonobacteraceae bacterium]
MAMIETSDVRKTFRGRRGPVEAVRGVNMRVEEGEIFGFLGPNGAGKTTTMRILTTLLEPSGGHAKVAGYDVWREPGKVRTAIGYVSQSGGAERSATARENIVLQGRLYGMSKFAAQKRAAELLSLLELDALADRKVITYSGGQRRRLDIAIGMVHRPKLLFLDEPTTGLDPQSRARVWDEVRSLHASGTTLFITTHYLDEADALCNRLAIIDNGQIVVEGAPDALKQQIAGDVVTLGLDTHDGVLQQARALLHSQPYVRESQVEQDKLRLYVERGEESLPTILRMLDDAHIPVHTIALARPTLDDVFLRQTGRSLRETAN